VLGAAKVPKGADIVRAEISALAKVTFSHDLIRRNWPSEKESKTRAEETFFLLTKAF